MAKKRDAVGFDPLATLLQNTGAIQTPKETPSPTLPASSAGRGDDDTRAADKPRFTVRIPASLQDQVRDVCYWDRITVTEFVERAFAAELARLEVERGEPYPERASALKPGRPVRL